ncbi:ATP-binding protein [Cryobacterium breve]|uniref:ATP-binding protein n=1 Tax=Cryobacterium breve TaxID=1259258 RepID=A0ABY7NE95_9MICO|nr:ATP-binding protein [Cryobacterium breve]WBM79116.1 ATP-binding protein [Cryobacterium breve]
MITFASDVEDERPLSTLEGLTRYLKSDSEAPAKLTIDQYTALDRAVRNRYDTGRLDYLAGNVIVVTPQVKEVRTLVENMVGNNRRRPEDKRPGLILSGGGTAGKTSSTQLAMRRVYDDYAAQVPNMAERGRHPVVYVEVPFGSNGKSFLTAFTRFFGMTVTNRETQSSLMDRVCEALHRAKTELIVVDELQNLNNQNRGNGESIQVLRQLHSQVLGIFVLAGVNLGESPLFEGPTGQQLASRMTFLELHSFSRANKQSNSEWRGLIRAFEKEMPLLAHTVGSLTEHSDVIHSHTGGSISTLAKIFYSSTNALIHADNPHAESISLKLLLAQPRDKTAMEAGTEEPTPKAPPRTTTKAKGAKR